jgi:hypothetical protein
MVQQVGLWVGLASRGWRYGGGMSGAGLGGAVGSRASGWANKRVGLVWSSKWLGWVWVGRVGVPLTITPPSRKTST